jgi:predicted TIM-barrel fold metal-dependent hydrolase
MYNGYRVVDADSHVMEPDDLWDKYLDRRFRAHAPRTRRISPENPNWFSIEVAGHRWSSTEPTTRIPYIGDGRGGLVNYLTAYADYIRQGFSPAAYLQYMDSAGIDVAVLYPTLTLHATAVPELEPALAAAIKRAYNDWLADFCDRGNGRLIGVAALDLRDVDLAVKEARRCVRELGFRAVYILPETPYEDRPLDHPYYDPLWAEVAALGVPLGTHEAMFHKNGEVGWVGAKQVSRTGIRYAPTAVTFGLGEMVAALMFAGAICARHPDLRVLFTESSVGWAATWLEYLDERWERNARVAPGTLPEHPPSYYFRRQCAISGDPGERGFTYAVDAGFEDCLMIATDFPHPEVLEFPRVLSPLFDGAHARLSEAQLRKILWDNPARLFGLDTPVSSPAGKRST